MPIYQLIKILYNKFTMSTQQQIYNAAIQRLRLKFSQSQAELLALMMIPMAQFETNNFTSNVFKNNNNAFGYKYFPGSAYQIGRGTAAPQTGGDSGSYGRYATVADSAKEVADWIGRGQAAFKNVKTIPDFVQALKFGRPGYEYFHTPTGKTDQQIIDIYTRSMQNFASSALQTASSATTGSGPLFFVLLLAGLALGVLNKKSR